MLLLNPLPEIPGQLSLETVLWFELLTDSSWEDVGHIPLYYSKGVAFFPWKLFFPFFPRSPRKIAPFFRRLLFLYQNDTYDVRRYERFCSYYAAAKGSHCKNVTQ